MRRVYLAGAMELVDKDYARAWRVEAKRAMDRWANLDAVDPMEYEDFEASDEEIVNIDTALIHSSDGILVDGRQPGWGTSQEVLIAWEESLPVVVWGIPRERASKWLRFRASAIVESLDEAVFAIASLVA